MTEQRQDAEAIEKERVEKEAADWIVRLSDPALAAEERERLRRERDRWLAAAPLHRAGYAELERTWRLLREAALSQRTLSAEPPAPAATPLPAPSAISPAAPRRGALPARPAARSRSWRRRSALGLAAGIALCLLTGLARFYLGDPLTVLTADRSTAPGETQSVALPDGSSLLLGSNSAVTIDFDERRRLVRLLAGEAAFEVAPEPGGAGRPFVVEAEGLEAQALGTRFQLERRAAGVSVTVVEHLVRVSHAGAREEAVVLGPGERLTMPADGAPELLEQVDVGRATAWQHGRLVFDRQPLSAVVASLNRHRRGEIVIGDAELAGREVSGVFRLDELDGALERIARELDAKTLELPPFVSLLY